jgi:hypothetical protein
LLGRNIVLVVGVVIVIVIVIHPVNVVGQRMGLVTCHWRVGGARGGARCPLRGAAGWRES